MLKFDSYRAMWFGERFVISAAVAVSLAGCSPVAATSLQTDDALDIAIDNMVAAVEADPIEARATEREQSRWWIVTADVHQLTAIDTHTLRSDGSLRIGWQALLPLEKSSVGAVLMRHTTWNCATKTFTEGKWAVYNPKGDPVPMQSEKSETEAIIPESNGEAVLEFVCGERKRGEFVPMPVARPLREAALIFHEYTGGKEATILGMWLSTFDPEGDRETLEKFLEIATEPRRTRIRQLLWPTERVVN